MVLNRYRNYEKPQTNDKRRTSTDLNLRGDIPLIAQLVLPHVIRLLDGHPPGPRHVGVHADPQHGRVGVKRRTEVHVDLFTGDEWDFLLLVSATFRVTRDLVVADSVFNLHCVRKRTV